MVNLSTLVYSPIALFDTGAGVVFSHFYKIYSIVLSTNLLDNLKLRHNLKND